MFHEGIRLHSDHEQDPLIALFIQELSAEPAPTVNGDVDTSNPDICLRYASCLLDIIH